jgi:hypothetical protein
MLVAQAAAQFELWTGEAAPVEVMSRAAESRLTGRTVGQVVPAEGPRGGSG